MNNKNLTPEQSLKLISSVITEAKARFEEDGVVYMMWGLLVAIASFTQFYLLTHEFQSVSFYPWFLMPIGFILSGVYYSRKGSKKGGRSHLSIVISTMWICISINILLLGFGFAMVLAENLIPLILLLTGIGIAVSGSILKTPLLLIAGIIMNIIGIGTFFVAFLHQPLLLGFANLACVFLPGLLIMRRHNRTDV